MAAALCMPAGGIPISLFEYGVNIDGDSRFPFDGDPLQGGVDVLGFDALTGLGTVSIAVTGDGAHFVGLFVDHEIDEILNTFFNEVGSMSGAPAAGQSFETEEPGFVGGDIMTNFVGGTLDGSIGPSPDDVSMALGWDFLLLPGESALIDFSLSETAPGSGFYLEHADPASKASVFLSSSKKVIGGQGGQGVPDGGSSLLLLLCGLAGIGAAAKWRPSDHSA